MIEKASRSLQGRLGFSFEKEVDLILTNVELPRFALHRLWRLGEPSPRLQAEVGARPPQHGLRRLRLYDWRRARTHGQRRDQERASLLRSDRRWAGVHHPENRVRPQSSVPGDGCGVGYVVANDESPIRGFVQHSYGEYADDMRVICDEGAPWWEAHRTSLYVDFTESKVAKVVARGSALVPRVVTEACKTAELALKDIDLLVTNQPNAFFLRNWREALLLPKEKQVETFEEYGNLFGAAIPINIERAAEQGLLKKGRASPLADSRMPETTPPQPCGTCEMKLVHALDLTLRDWFCSIRIRRQRCQHRASA